MINSKACGGDLALQMQIWICSSRRIEEGTQDTVQQYEEELERMLELKRERMGTFVENAREEIVKLWDDLMVGDEERADFRLSQTVRLHVFCKYSIIYINLR